MGPKAKRDRRETLTDLILEFLEAAVHEFLCSWKIYPPESFTRRVLYDVPVHMSRHPLLCEYIHSMLHGCRQWIRNGELEKLCVLTLGANGQVLHTMTFEASWSHVNVMLIPDDEPLPLLAIEEEFRSALVALTAAPFAFMGMDDSSPPASFRLLAYTNEDASRPLTAINESAPANSWVYADRHWYDEETKQEPELLPIKSTKSDTLPFRLQLYMEKR